MISWSLTLVLTAAIILPLLAVYVFSRGKHPVVTWALATAAIAAHIIAWQVIDNVAAGTLLVIYEITGLVCGPVILELFDSEEG